MTGLRVLLVVSSVAIYALTATASLAYGVNWPAVAIGDLMALNWRTQFDFDFIVHLFLMATWVTWREGATRRAYVFGILSVVMGGMFSFPYIAYATYAAGGDPRALLLGVHAGKPA